MRVRCVVVESIVRSVLKQYKSMKKKENKLVFVRACSYNIVSFSKSRIWHPSIVVLCVCVCVAQLSTELLASVCSSALHSSTNLPKGEQLYWAFKAREFLLWDEPEPLIPAWLLPKAPG